MLIKICIYLGLNPQFTFYCGIPGPLFCPFPPLFSALYCSLFPLCFSLIIPFTCIFPLPSSTGIITRSRNVNICAVAKWSHMQQSYQTMTPRSLAGAQRRSIKVETAVQCMSQYVYTQACTFFM